MLVLKCPRILRLVIVQAHDLAGIKCELTSDLSLDSLAVIPALVPESPYTVLT
jgi:hypothetical protein